MTGLSAGLVVELFLLCPLSLGWSGTRSQGLGPVSPASPVSDSLNPESLLFSCWLTTVPELLSGAESVLSEGGVEAKGAAGAEEEVGEVSATGSGVAARLVFSDIRIIMAFISFFVSSFSKVSSRMRETLDFSLPLKQVPQGNNDAPYCIICFFLLID